MESKSEEKQKKHKLAIEEAQEYYVENALDYLKEKFPEITEEEYKKALLTCNSSIFDYDILGPVLAELISIVEQKKYIYANLKLKVFDDRTVVDGVEGVDYSIYEYYWAIIEESYISKIQEQDGFYLLKGIGYFEDYACNYISAFGKYSFWKFSEDEKIKCFYEPLPVDYLEKYEGELYTDYTNIAPKMPYVQEFIKGIILYREKVDGRELTQDELYELMEYYIDTYNPSPYKSRDIILTLK